MAAHWERRLPTLPAEMAEHGAVWLQGVLDPPMIAALAEAVERCRTTPGRHYRRLSPEGVPPLESELFRWADTPAFRALGTGGPLPAIAASVFGAATVILMEDQWFRSAPGAEQESPWHQDHPYHPLEPAFLTVWLPLDPVPAGAGLKLVRGSHRGPIFAPVEFSTTAATLGDGSGSAGLAPAEAMAAAVRDRWAPPARPGDAVLIDSRTLHAAGGACDTLFRRLSFRFAPIETRITPRAWPVATFWSDHAHSAVPGAALESPAFPAVTAARSTCVQMSSSERRLI